MPNHALSITFYLTSILLFIIAILGFSYGSEPLFHDRPYIIGIALGLSYVVGLGVLFCAWLIALLFLKNDTQWKGVVSDMESFSRVLLKPVRQLIFVRQLYQMSAGNLQKVSD